METDETNETEFYKVRLFNNLNQAKGDGTMLELKKCCTMQHSDPIAGRLPAFTRTSRRVVFPRTLEGSPFWKAGPQFLGRWAAGPEAKPLHAG